MDGNPMHVAKQDALHAINQLPDSADMEEIMYRLFVLDKVRKGQQAVEDGQTLTSEELQHEIDSWWFGHKLLRLSWNTPPGIGKMVDEIGEPNIKELSIYSYRIMYEVKASNAHILAVVHKRRGFKAEDLA